MKEWSYVCTKRNYRAGAVRNNRIRNYRFIITAPDCPKTGRLSYRHAILPRIPSPPSPSPVTVFLPKQPVSDQTVPEVFPSPHDRTAPDTNLADHTAPSIPLVHRPPHPPALRFWTRYPRAHDTLYSPTCSSLSRLQGWLRRRSTHRLRQATGHPPRTPIRSGRPRASLRYQRSTARSRPCARCSRALATTRRARTATGSRASN